MLYIVVLFVEEGVEKVYIFVRLNICYKGDFKYGCFEMCVKLLLGQGSWFVFWMFFIDYVYGGWLKLGEIDIMEVVNLKVVDVDGNVELNIYGILYYGCEWLNNVNLGKVYVLFDGVNFVDDFYIYVIEWQEGEICWYMDGYLYVI